MPKRQPLSSKQDPVSEYGYTVIYEKLAAGGYQVIVPALPEIITYGTTLLMAPPWRKPAT